MSFFRSYSTLIRTSIALFSIMMIFITIVIHYININIKNEKIVDDKIRLSLLHELQENWHLRLKFNNIKATNYICQHSAFIVTLSGDKSYLRYCISYKYFYSPKLRLFSSLSFSEKKMKSKDYFRTYFSKNFYSIIKKCRDDKRFSSFNGEEFNYLVIGERNKFIDYEDRISFFFFYLLIITFVCEYFCDFQLLDILNNNMVSQ